MPVEKPEIFSGFFRFSPFSGTSLSKCGFSQNSNLIKNKKMPNADFDLPSGIGLANDNFRAVFREFFSPKTALFSFSSKKYLLNNCVHERRYPGSPTNTKKKIATAVTACIIPKENANCSGAVAIRTKSAQGPPSPKT